MVIGIPPRKIGPRLGWSVHRHQEEAAAQQARQQETQATGSWPVTTLVEAAQVEQIRRRLWLELHDRQARYSLEVADVQRGNVVAEMQRCRADQ